MAINMLDYDEKARAEARSFWLTRRASRLKQIESDKLDQGERSGVMAGKNMDGFVNLMSKVVRANGLADAEIHKR